MDISLFINAWLAACNAFDTLKYLDFYAPDSVLDDPSVGRKFMGHHEIKQYFESYFIGYNTQTERVDLVVHDAAHAQLEVTFTGDFAEGSLGGTFDFTFESGKIAFVKADLIH